MPRSGSPRETGPNLAALRRAAACFTVWTVSRLRVVHTPYVPLTDAEGRSQSKLQPYPPMRDPCRLCAARCCHTSVKASLPDVIRLCHTLQIPFFAAFTFEHSSHPDRGIRLDKDDRFVDPEDGWTGLGEIRMRRGDTGGCVGLVELGGYVRCGMYGARPMSCRLYPISWEDEEDRGGPDAVLCPAPYAVTPPVAEQAVADAEQDRRQWRLHEVAVAKWNAAETPATLEAALGFLLSEVAQALGLSLDPVVLSSGTADQRLTRELSDRGMLFGQPSSQAEPFAGLPAVGRPR